MLKAQRWNGAQDLALRYLGPGAALHTRKQVTEPDSATRTSTTSTDSSRCSLCGTSSNPFFEPNTSRTRSQNQSSFQRIRTEEAIYIAKCDDEMESNDLPRDLLDEYSM